VPVAKPFTSISLLPTAVYLTQLPQVPLAVQSRTWVFLTEGALLKAKYTFPLQLALTVRYVPPLLEA